MSYCNGGCGSTNNSLGILLAAAILIPLPLLQPLSPSSLTAPPVGPIQLVLDLRDEPDQGWIFLLFLESCLLAWAAHSLVILHRVVLGQGMEQLWGATSAAGKGCIKMYLCHKKYFWTSKSIFSRSPRKARTSTHYIIKLAKEQTSESSQSFKIGQGRNQVMITACSSSLPKFRLCYHYPYPTIYFKVSNFRLSD